MDAIGQQQDPRNRYGYGQDSAHRVPPAQSADSWRRGYHTCAQLAVSRVRGPEIAEQAARWSWSCAAICEAVSAKLAELRNKGGPRDRSWEERGGSSEILSESARPPRAHDLLGPLPCL